MAKLKLVQTNLPDRISHRVRNAESSAAIPLGTPLVLNLTGTKAPSSDQNGKAAGYEDGLQVVLPSTAGAAATIAYQYGVATSRIANQDYGDAQLHGLVPYALIVFATRAASTDSWTSSASIAASLWLKADTVNNAFSTMGSGSATSDDKRAFAAILVDSIASFAASASNTSDTRTAQTALKRVFIRQM